MIFIGGCSTLDVSGNQSRNELVLLTPGLYIIVMEKMALSYIVEKQEMMLRATRLMN